MLLLPSRRSDVRLPLTSASRLPSVHCSFLFHWNPLVYRIAVLSTLLLCCVSFIVQAAPIVPSSVVPIGDSTATSRDTLQHYSSTLDSTRSIVTSASDTVIIGLAGPTTSQSKLPSPFAMV